MATMEPRRRSHHRRQRGAGDVAKAAEVYAQHAVQLPVGDVGDRRFLVMSRRTDHRVDRTQLGGHPAHRRLDGGGVGDVNGIRRGVVEVKSCNAIAVLLKRRGDGGTDTG